MTYPVVIHKDADSDYGVTVPDPPGCFSAGSTVEETLLMAREAIELYIEVLVEDGRDIPEPTPFDRLFNHPDYAGGVWELVSAEYPPRPAATAA